MAEAARRAPTWLYRLEQRLAGREFHWLNGLPFLLPSLRRRAFAHHRARVDVSLTSLEAEIARTALQRHGWQHVATRNSGTAIGDDQVTTLAFTVLVRSGSNSVAIGLARELTVALADARVRGPHHYVVDPAHGGYQPLPEWRPAATDSNVAASSLRDRTAARRRRREGQSRFFGNGDVTSVRVWSQEVDPGAPDLEPVGTPSERLHRGVVAAREALETRLPALALFAAACVLMLVSLVVTQVFASRAPEAAGKDLYLWTHVDRLGWALIATGALSGAAAGVSKVAGHRYRGVPRCVAVLAGGLAVGMFVGGYARQHISLGQLAGFAVVGAIAVLWRLANRVRWRLLTILLRVSTIAVLAATVVAYGRWRLVIYYAGMGISAGEVDIPAIDALTVAVKPLFWTVVPVAVLLSLAWFVAGWSSPPGLGLLMTIVAVATGASLLLGTLQADERRGRRIGVGLGEVARGGPRVAPGPTAACLISLTPEPAALGEPLPQTVWRMGSFGQLTLLLDPTRAQGTDPNIPDDPSERRAYVPSHNVDSPIWYVPTNQMKLIASGAGPC